MIQIDDKIVSTDLLTEKFCCDPSRCKGACCVEGNAGAPLEAEEIEILEREYETYKPYLKPEGIAAIERQGFMVVDRDGDYTTPLIGDAECAFSFEENGITLCAIERAYNEGRTGFVKPISCHLYRIRQRIGRPELPPLEHLQKRLPARPPIRRSGLSRVAHGDRAPFRRTVFPGARRSGIPAEPTER